MVITIHPSRLNGPVQAPASKSSMQRACAAALIRQGESHIHNPGHSNDDKAAVNIIERLGASLEDKGELLVVSSRGINPVKDEIQCGESGLSIRMFTPLAALSGKAITISGTGSLVSRPMDFFDEILPRLGVAVETSQGRLPIKLRGPLQPQTIEVDGSLSSQFLTGLLMAYAAAGASGVSIRVHNLRSRPYIDLTLDVMRKFGLKVPENRSYEKFIFHAGEALPVSGSPVNYTVEGDWSGGAFLLVAGVLAGPVTVRGLDPLSAQADKAILDALLRANAGMAMDTKGIHLHPSPLTAFDFDATDCPDLFPPLVALAAYAEGISSIKGVSRLAHKESNRALTLQEEFGKMGLKIEIEGDLMRVYGGQGLTGASVHSHHDHRIAMACAVAALRADGPVVIEQANAVNKSYPGFFRDLEKLGAKLTHPFASFNL
ncbi:MAG: 3-phosphoshikimate 1-carboxyvinyltransferase [Chitinophagaceae bacterium]|nr:3-phosphoshikimate 1-carboxyvinyltransferase [Chitinophagaceae bacterium]